MKKIKLPLNNGLYIVATPIGNLEDISLRAIEILKNSNIIICENPKHSLKLLNYLGIKKRLVALHDYNEEEIIGKISKHLESSLVTLISDAGSPLISDPGYKLVQYCIKKNIYLTSVPGASSVICALQNSGISINSFCFYGFVPKKKSQANELFHITNKLSGTKVFFSSSHRLITNLQLIQSHFGNKKIAICKELTKYNEVIIRTTADKAKEEINKHNQKIKGEYVLVVEGSKDNNAATVDNKIEDSLIKISEKFSLTDSVKIVHKLTGLSKKELYDVALEKIRKKNA